MTHAFLLVLVASILSAGCSAVHVPRTPDLSDYTAHDILGRARDQNWTVRVHLNNEHYEGRVRFVQLDSARVGDASIPVEGLTMIERYATIDLGGKRTGAVMGGVAGLLVGYLARDFVEYGNEGGCGLDCAVVLYGSSTAILGLIGGVIGSIVDPPIRQWITVWSAAP